MSALYFSEDHEWLAVDENYIATVGITDHAQQALGDIVFVDLPVVGRVVKKGEAIAAVESVKAASDVNSPVAGTVLEVNNEIISQPSLINEDPEGAAWFFKLRLSDPSAVSTLMDRAAYDTFLGTHS